MTVYARLYLPSAKIDEYAKEYSTVNGLPGINWISRPQVLDFRRWFFTKTKFHLVDDADSILHSTWFMLVPPDQLVEAKLKWL